MATHDMLTMTDSMNYRKFFGFISSLNNLKHNENKNKKEENLKRFLPLTYTRMKSWHWMPYCLGKASISSYLYNNTNIREKRGKGRWKKTQQKTSSHLNFFRYVINKSNLKLSKLITSKIKYMKRRMMRFSR